MRRHEVKDCQKTIQDYMSKGGMSEVPNGNTPSPLSPTNSVGSQVSSHHLKNSNPVSISKLIYQNCLFFFSI